MNHATPVRPEHLRICSHRGAVEQCARAASGPATGTLVLEGFLTFEQLFERLGAPTGRRYAGPWVTFFLVRALLARCGPAGGTDACLSSNDADSHDKYDIRDISDDRDICDDHEVCVCGDHDDHGGPRASACDPRSVKAAQRALDELRSSGITAEHLRRAQLPATATALVSLLAQYGQALDAAGLFDDADRQRDAVLAVAQGRAPWLAAYRDVTVEGGATFFASRTDLLRALAARGGDVTARVPFDPERRAAFAWAEAALHHLESCTAGTARLEVRLDSRTREGPLAELRAAQFSSRTVEQAPVKVLRVGSMREHAQAAGLAVLRWIESGIAPHDIVIAMPSGVEQSMGPAVVRELAQLGVAARLRHGPRLSRTRPARALMLALEAPQRGYLRDDIIALLDDLSFEVATPLGAFGPERLAELLRQAGVRSARVGGYRAPLLAWAKREGKRRDGEAFEAAVTAVADALEQLMATLARVAESASPHEQLASALALAQALGLCGATSCAAGQEAARALGIAPVTAPAAATTLAQRDRRAEGAPPECELVANVELARAIGVDAQASTAIDELLTTLCLAARTCASDAPVMTRHELAALIELTLGGLCLGSAAGPVGAIDVLTIDDLVETSVGRLVLLGIDASLMPRARASDMVLTEELRAAINRALGPRLLQASPMSGREPLSADARDYWLWLEALAACRDELLITCTRLDAHGDAGGYSDFVRELERSVAGVTHEFVPPYAASRVRCPAHARLRWAYGRGQRTGAVRLHTVGSAGTAACDALLRRIDGAGLARAERRAGVELERRRGFSSLAFAEADRSRLEATVLGRVQSTSRLDMLGKCAFRFFASCVLDLSHEELPRLGADAREEGSATHAAMCLVYRHLGKSGGMAAARREPEKALLGARRLVAESCDKVLAETNIHPLLRDAALETVQRAVQTCLRRDLDEAQGREPLVLEYPFDDRPGVAARALELPSPDRLRRVVVRGSIDRIDRTDRTECTECTECTERDAVELAVLDYKRSIINRSPGRHFQLPIYLAVALRDFGDSIGTVSAGWIDLRRGKTKWAIGPGTPREAFLAELSSELWQRLGLILSGNAAVDPDSTDLCNRCDVKGVCRYVPPVGDVDDQGEQS